MIYSALIKWVLSWIGNPKVWIGIGITICLVCGYIHYTGLHDTIEDQKQEIALIKDRLSKCMLVNSANEIQSKKIDQYVETAEKSMQEAVEKQTALIDAQLRRSIEKWNKTPKPTTCQESIDLLVDAAKGNRS